MTQAPGDSELPADVRAALEDGRWVRRVAARLVRDDDADDVAQDACVVALERGRDVKTSMRRWLRSVIRNLVRERARRRDRREDRERRLARGDGTPSTLEIVERVHVHQKLHDVLLELDEPYREVLFLRYFEDRKPREIAALLSIPVSTVKTRLDRGLKKMRARLDANFGSRASWTALLAPIARLEPFEVPWREAPPRPIAATAGVVAIAGSIALAWQPGDVDTVTATPATVAAPSGLRVDEPGASSEAETVRRAVAVAVPDWETRLPSVDSPALQGRVVAVGGARRVSVEVVFRRATSWPLPWSLGPGRMRDLTNFRGVFSIPGASGRGVLATQSPELVTLFASLVDTKSRRGPYAIVVAKRRLVTGTVVDPSGRPVAGARVRLVPPDGFEGTLGLDVEEDTLFASEFFAETDAAGEFRLADAFVLSGARLRVEALGFAPHDDLAPASDSCRVTLHPPTGPSLSGRVIDGGGLPVVNAVVSNGHDRVHSDVEGRFRIPMPEAGPEIRELVAAKSGYAPAKCAAEDDAILRLEESRSIRGRVVDVGGTPIEGAVVWIVDGTLLVQPQRAEGVLNDVLLRGTNRGRRPVLAESVACGRDATCWRPVRTQADGSFELSGLASRAYRVAAMEIATLTRTEKSCAPGAHGVELRLPRRSSRALRGRVLGRDGRSVPGARIALQIDVVEARSSTSRPCRAWVERRIQRSDDEGRFAMRVPSGGQRLVVTGPTILPTAVHVRSEANVVDVIADARGMLRVAGITGDSIRVVDAEGRARTLWRLDGRRRVEALRLPLVHGRTGSIALAAGPSTVKLYRGTELVGERQILVVAGRVTQVRF